uniref:Uncharacterized protein n=1 Tax=Siphoviridae sp. ctbgC51 TaxID=2827901 RepID=A0A8S5TER9_9CAUD|nr:MAG TPA: hypothetical protein [Siphoviridae sp. ctbgC51]
MGCLLQFLQGIVTFLHDTKKFLLQSIKSICTDSDAWSDLDVFIKRVQHCLIALIDIVSQINNLHGIKKVQNTINLDKESKNLLREADNKEELFRSLRFCVPRLQRCDQVQEI